MSKTMSEVVEVSSAAVCSTIADAVTPQHDAAKFSHAVGDDLCMVSGDGRSAEDTVDGSALTANDKPQSDAAVASELVNAGGPAHSTSSAGKVSVSDDEGVKDSDSIVDQPTSAQVPDYPVVDPSVTAAIGAGDAPAKSNDGTGGGDVGCSSAGTPDRIDASEKSRLSTVGRAPPLPTSAARHALPSAVAAPRATGKHRLPPVLTHEKTTAAGQAHALERMSPLSLVCGPAADSVRASASLTGGTRLGDLGLLQPPLNLSVSDEAVNMKVVNAATLRSSSDAASRAGTYSWRYPQASFTLTPVRVESEFQQIGCSLLVPASLVRV